MRARVRPRACVVFGQNLDHDHIIIIIIIIIMSSTWPMTCGGVSESATVLIRRAATSGGRLSSTPNLHVADNADIRSMSLLAALSPPSPLHSLLSALSALCSLLSALCSLRSPLLSLTLPSLIFPLRSRPLS